MMMMMTIKANAGADTNNAATAAAFLQATSAATAF
jgi:hypothetical protein